MIQEREFSELENLIRWGGSSFPHQEVFIARVQAQPALAKDADAHGTTLLMVAAEVANLDAARLLCRLGADVNAEDLSGNNPLICVVQGGRDDLAQDNNFFTRSTIVDQLVRSGANPNKLGYQGCSALQCAIIFGQVNLVERLLLGGGDASQRLSDYPSNEDAYELVKSNRFRGSDSQREAILCLLDASAVSQDRVIN